MIHTQTFGCESHLKAELNPSGLQSAGMPRKQQGCLCTTLTASLNSQNPSSAYVTNVFYFAISQLEALLIHATTAGCRLILAPPFTDALPPYGLRKLAQFGNPTP